MGGRTDRWTDGRIDGPSDSCFIAPKHQWSDTIAYFLQPFLVRKLPIGCKPGYFHGFAVSPRGTRTLSGAYIEASTFQEITCILVLTLSSFLRLIH